MDDMIFKYGEDNIYEIHLNVVFNHVSQFNKRLNLEKCMFIVKTG